MSTSNQINREEAKFVVSAIYDVLDFWFVTHKQVLHSTRIVDMLIHILR